MADTDNLWELWGREAEAIFEGTLITDVDWFSELDEPHQKALRVMFVAGYRAGMMRAEGKLKVATDGVPA